MLHVNIAANPIAIQSKANANTMLNSHAEVHMHNSENVKCNFLKKTALLGFKALFCILYVSAM